MAGQASDNDDRVLRARIAAHLLHAQISDEAEHTAPARAAFLSRFEREVDPDGLLDPVGECTTGRTRKKGLLSQTCPCFAESTSQQKARQERRKTAQDEGGQS